MLAADGVKDEDGTFQSAKPVLTPMLSGDVAASEVDEAGLPGVENAAVGEDVPDIFVAQVALSEATTGVLGDA